MVVGLQHATFNKTIFSKKKKKFKNKKKVTTKEGKEVEKEIKHQIPSQHF